MRALCFSFFLGQNYKMKPVQSITFFLKALRVLEYIGGGINSLECGANSLECGNITQFSILLSQNGFKFFVMYTTLVPRGIPLSSS